MNFFSVDQSNRFNVISWINIMCLTKRNMHDIHISSVESVTWV